MRIPGISVCTGDYKDVNPTVGIMSESIIIIDKYFQVANT